MYMYSISLHAGVELQKVREITSYSFAGCAEDRGAVSMEVCSLDCMYRMWAHAGHDSYARNIHCEEADTIGW